MQRLPRVEFLCNQFEMFLTATFISLALLMSFIGAAFIIEFLKKKFFAVRNIAWNILKIPASLCSAFVIKAI